MSIYQLNDTKFERVEKSHGCSQRGPCYSKKCIDKVFELFDKSGFDLIVEPSAGDGSFFNQFDSGNLIALDISPENENIIEMISLIMV